MASKKNKITQSTDAKLLRILKDNAGAFTSGEKLSKELKVSRNAVWKKINLWKKIGYKFDSNQHEGYKLISSPNLILPEEVAYYLKSTFIGQQMSVFDAVDSTNRIALDWGSKNVAEGFVVVAESQKKGRGRLGRSWLSPKGKGLYFSIILRPKLTIPETPFITLLTAVAISDAIQKLTKLNVGIKWPNDLLIQNKKCCGILTELNAESDRVNFLVIGIGINVNGSSPLSKIAKTIEEASGKTWDRSLLLARVLESIESYYYKWQQGKISSIISKWNKGSTTVGKMVEIKTLNENIKGRALKIDSTGALVIKTKDKLNKKVFSGDVV